MMKTGRNNPCPCGSGLKYKHCCLGKQSSLPFSQKALIAVLVTAVLIGISLIVVSMRDHDFTNTSGANRVWSEEHKHWHYQ